jgi:hypothetical protein
MEFSNTAISGQNRILSYNRSTSAYVPMTIVGYELKFDIGTSEAMRIDTSGNLLVGTTNVNNNAEDGVRIKADGTLQVRSDNSGFVATLNRSNASDGDILTFAKSNTTVGSIGVTSTQRLTIGSSVDTDVGLVFQPDTDKRIYPVGDDVVELGRTGHRFKDLMLSGGVYLGGTGSANKLDDYEEGTWTPSVAAGSISGTSIIYTGTYRKIGSIVLIRFQASNTTGDINVSSYVAFSGLPFTCNMTATSTVTTEDIDVFDRQGFAQMGSTTLTLSNCGSTSGTTDLSVSIVGHTA